MSIITLAEWAKRIEPDIRRLKRQMRAERRALRAVTRNIPWKEPESC